MSLLSSSPALYSSAVQHVLLLQEEQVSPNSDASATHADAKPWNTHLNQDSSSPLRSQPICSPEILNSWRVRDRMRTVNGALVLCLNIGVDPPDVSKPSPCARLECWHEPSFDNPAKSLQHIANALRSQYESWYPKIRYKVVGDPTVAELKRVCIGLRKAAKKDRVLFHYNGHGVPKPTKNGEIWVFNQNYTQYIPLNLYDLHEVLGSPSFYVFDCNSAGTVFEHFQKMMEQLDRDCVDADRKGDKEAAIPLHRNSILLAACSENEILPTTPDVPADLFTSCLTTPMKTALRWFAKRTLVKYITNEMLDHIPGNITERRTPLGELHWIFTAITDTIAWNVLPRDLFMKLYRQDTILASLMRNFLLADRIMRSYGCKPMSQPALPATHKHSLWHSFDLSMEQVLVQLPALIQDEYHSSSKLAEGSITKKGTHSAVPSSHAYAQRNNEQPLNSGSPRRMEYRPSSFFEDQMKAFDVWLNMGPNQREAPEQLPIMLQVLLSPSFRPNALSMLSRYLQTGPVAVDHALSVGIFPYVLRLVHSQLPKMQQELVFIWSKILAVDDTCRSDLLKEKGETVFVQFLSLRQPPHPDPEPVYLAAALFVLSVLAKDAVDTCIEAGALDACYSRLTHPSPFVRRWSCLCLTEMIRQSNPQIQIKALAWEDLIRTLRNCVTSDTAPDVRAAAITTLSSILCGVLASVAQVEQEAYSSSGMRSSFQNTPHPAASSGPQDLKMLPLLRLTQEISSLSTDDVQPLRSRINSEGHQSSIVSDSEGSSNSRLPPASSEESEAILRIGSTLAKISQNESSVLVRREIAIAIARAVQFRDERFVHAAVVIDMHGIDEPEDPLLQSNLERCECVYRKLWKALSELAYDPHPIVAALARRSYDAVSDGLLKRSSGSKVPGKEPSEAGSLPMDRMFSPPESTSDESFVQSTTRTSPDVNLGPDSGSLPSSLRSDSATIWARSPSSGRNMVEQSDSDRGLYPRRGDTMDRPPLSTTTQSRSNANYLATRAISKTLQGQRSDNTIKDGSIHVRSSSGSFDLSTPSRLRLSRIPRVYSASLLPVLSRTSTVKEGLNDETCELDNSCSNPDGRNSSNNVVEDGPRSLPHIALAKGLGNLVKSVSKQINLAGMGGTSSSLSSNASSRECVEGREEKISKAISPPRPPRRSLSYQVLNAASSMSPSREAPVFSSSKTTSYLRSIGAVDGTQRSSSNPLPHGYERSYLSGAGDAALSLYEWSCGCISRVEFDSTTVDYMPEEEPIPRYAALWDKFEKSSAETPVEESLRAFAVQRERRNVSGAEVDDDKKDIEAPCEVSSNPMGAGGGAILAMTFLPRDIGMGDDQLIATGDSTGSVGVYDIITGSCQGSFGIPCPPGVPDVGVSSILCLNPLATDKFDGYSSLSNSMSALILAGAYDGRVAVFKSDVRGPKYRIMSTFQASGTSFWSKVGIGPSYSHPFTHQKSTGMSSSCSNSSVADLLHNCGNGLIVAFDSDSSSLIAGGCDNEKMRVWDLTREQCVWEGTCVRENTWPTAVSAFNRINPNMFAVGSSDGRVNTVDTRMNSTSQTVNTLGYHDDPVISAGTFPKMDASKSDVVATADICGNIVLWDTRWNGAPVSQSSMMDKPYFRRIQAHRSKLTAMAVHPSGRYIASGSTAKCVKIFGPNRQMVKMILHQGSGSRPFQTQNRLAAVSSLEFRHESSLLAVGCVDSSVMIYGWKDRLLRQDDYSYLRRL